MRLEEAERRSDAERAGAAPPSPDAPAPVAERELTFDRAEEERLARELTETETRLTEDERRTVDALERAAARLREAESRAAAAEERAQRAERLAAVKAEESERAERLREMLDRIAEAERRAGSAEERARAAVVKASEPLPEIDISLLEHEPRPPGTAPAPGPPARLAGDLDPAQSGPRHDPDSPHGDAVLEPTPPPASPPTEGAKAPVPDPAAPAPAGVEQGVASLNSATYEQLRSLGLSVTQTGRLLAHRERHGDFGSVEDIDRIPGFSRSMIDELKRRLAL